MAEEGAARKDAVHEERAVAEEAERVAATCSAGDFFSKGSGEGGSYTGAFPGFPSVSADFHQPPLRALSIPGAWVLRSPDLVVVSSFRMHCTFPIWKYRWCDAFNFDPRVLGIQPCHPSGSKPAAHFFRTEVRIRDLQVAMTSRYQLYQYQFFVEAGASSLESIL